MFSCHLPSCTTSTLAETFSFNARSSLKYLASQVLNEVIQTGSHDSIVDARVALRLAKQKILQGKQPPECVMRQASVYQDIHVGSSALNFLEQ